MYRWKNTDCAASADGGVGKAFVSSSSRPAAEMEDVEDVDGGGGGGEESDAFAPLPSELSSTGKQFSKSAKDKRRLREKRRSTGVAKLDDHQTLKSDELTTWNTSYNETPGIIDSGAGLSSTRIGSTNPSTAVDCDRRSVACPVPSTTYDAGEQRKQSHVTPDQTGQTTHHRNHGRDQKTSAEEIASERLRHQGNSEKVSSFKQTPEEPKGYTAVNWSNSSVANPDFTRNVCVRPFGGQKRSILKTNSRPIISPKPEMFASAPSSAPSFSLLGQRSSEEVRLMSRISELEGLLESEKKEKTTLEKFLSARDLRIRELESQIVTLNEDLDLADEDYLRLEQENHALARALSQLNVV